MISPEESTSTPRRGERPKLPEEDMLLNPRPNLKHIPELDGLRAIAIGLVMVYHYWAYQGADVFGQVVTAVARRGWCGVDIFFVISGFLITGILIDSRGKERYWRRFYIRRSLRIFPLYYAVLVLLLLVAGLIRVLDIPLVDDSIANIDKIWLNFFYLTNFAMGLFGMTQIPLEITWSLAVEEQYYLVYPFVVRWANRRQLFWVLVSAVTAAPLIRAVSYFVTGTSKSAYALPFCRMDALAVGGLATLAVRYGAPMVTAWIGRCAVPLWAVAITVLGTYSRAHFEFMTVGYSATALATAATIVRLQTGRDRWLVGLLRLRPLMFVGKVSYGLYLLHLFVRVAVDHGPVASLFSAHQTHLGVALVRVTVLLGGAVLLAAISWYGFERPILRLKERWAPSPASAARRSTADSRQTPQKQLRADGVGNNPRSV